MSTLNHKEDILALIERLKNKDRRAVARLITLIENGGPDKSKEIIKEIFPLTGNAYIIGITGPPGAGKSTLVNELASEYLKQGKKVAIIAVDPTSPFSGGALLGDRIRMKENFQEKNLFIRSMANRGQLGGLAQATKDVIHVLDAYGCDIILVETVGVGQSEVDIFKSAYTTLVICVPGLGDDIQAIKAGIMEITDIFVVNKADFPHCEKTVAEIEGMLDLSERIEVETQTHSLRFIRSKGWRPPIIKTIANQGKNITDLMELIEKHKHYLKESGYMEQRINFRNKHAVSEILKYLLSRNIDKFVFTQPEVETDIKKIQSGEKGSDPYSIAESILRKYMTRLI